MLADWMLHVNVTRKAEEVYHGLGGFRGGTRVTLRNEGLAGLVIYNTCNKIICSGETRTGRAVFMMSFSTHGVTATRTHTELAFEKTSVDY